LGKNISSAVNVSRETFTIVANQKHPDQIRHGDIRFVDFAGYVLNCMKGLKGQILTSFLAGFTLLAKYYLFAQF